MFKTGKGTLIVLSYLTIFNLNVAKAGDSKIVLAGQATEDDEPTSDYLKKPSKLIEAEIKDGRLASGTKFQTDESLPQIFFCPKQDEAQNCLAPKQFEKSQILECDTEPKLILEIVSRKNVPNTPCGTARTGTRLRFVYNVCHPEQVSRKHFSETIHLRYRDREDRHLFHLLRRIKQRRFVRILHDYSAAAMLSEKLLTRERQIKFEMDTKTYELIDETYYTTLKTEAKLKPKYKLQQLVPSEDMHLAWWIKPTHYYANFALQHENLIEPWNHMRSVIRSYAGKWPDKVFNVLTGEFDLPKREDEISTAVGKDQKYSIWVSIIIESQDYSDKGMAILMNNFIVKRSESRGDAGDSSPKVEEKQLYIDQLCIEDFCVDSLKQVFKNAGGEVRCCEINFNILGLMLSKNMFHTPGEVLSIPNLAQRSSQSQIEDTNPIDSSTISR